MAAYAPFCPVDVRILNKSQGEAAVREFLSATPQKLLILVPLVLCTELSLAEFFTALQGDGHSVHLFTDIPSNPSVEHLSALLRRLRVQDFAPTAILAIGGGSCMDLAKGVSAFFYMPPSLTEPADALRQAIRDKAYQTHAHPFVDVIAMPTTAGTGSEVTKWATIWNPESNEKLSVDCPECYARAAVLIPEWTAGMPAGLTLSTGLDALSHAMEAFWARARTPLSQALALSAIDNIRRFLPLALAEPGAPAFRREMCAASLLAGLAFSQTRTTACHSLSYPLTMLHHIPHGYAAALTLAPVLRRNLAAVPEIGRIDALFAGEGGFERWLSAVTNGIQPLRLSAFNINITHLPALADLAFTAGRMDNNPVAFTRDEALDILRECF